MQASPGQATRWIAFGSCVLAGLSNEVSGGALSLALRDAGAQLHAGALHPTATARTGDRL